MSLPDYYSRFNPDLLALVPPDCKTVLEIGCGAGALCEAYRRVNPGVEWYAAEINGEAAKQAREHCTVVYRADVEIDGLDALAIAEHADCAILGDILEHLVDPWRALRGTAELVQPGGQILASIPNTGHWTIIRDLLMGRWQYRKEGLLDRTHLRFFTLETIRELFGGAGLQVFEIRGRDLCNEGLEEWIGRTGIACTKEMRAYQFIVRAVKPIFPAAGNFHGVSIASPFESCNKIEPLHIHAIAAEHCCARPRILEPFATLGTVPGVKYTTGQIPDRCPDVIIQQRFRSLNLTHQRNMLNDDILLIAELDDDPAGLQGYAENDYIQLRAVHAVQVSTERLAEIVREYNPNVAVFENQIADLPPMHGPIMDRQVSIFYGAQNRESDWLPIMPTLNRIIAEFGNELEFQVIHDRAFFDALETTEKTFTPFCEYPIYRRLLGSCDIALLPLEPGRFNECKSDIKFLECAAEGVAVLASPTAYENTIDEAVTGVIYYGVRGFEDALRTLIQNNAMRHGFAERAYTYVRDHRMLGQHFRKRLHWYRELLQSKQALTQSLYERVPELAQHALADSPA